MKTKFILLATALFCLASCNNAELDNSAVDLGESSYVSPSGDVYTIEIVGDASTTKGSATPKSMGYASLSGDGRKTSATAQLKKNGTDVKGASYSWSITSSTYNSYFELGDSGSQTCTLYGKKIKSSTEMLQVTGTDGVGSASIKVPVEVTDNLTVDWETKSMTLISGEQQSNTVQTNHAGASVTVDCPSGCKIGKSSASETSSVTLTTDSNGKATVYVKYTGTSDKTLSLKAASGNHSASSDITAKKASQPTPKTTSVSWGLRYSSTGALVAVLKDSAGNVKEKAYYVYPLQTYTFSNVVEGDVLELQHPDDWVLSTDAGPFESVRGVIFVPAYGHSYDGCDTP